MNFFKFSYFLNFIKKNKLEVFSFIEIKYDHITHF